MVVAFRIANWDTPLWVNPNRRDSRYLRDDGDIVQYWALHPLTCWAEYLRGLNIREPDEVRELFLRPWVAEVQVPGDVLSVSFASAQEYGLEPSALVDDDWSACKHWARGLSVSGLIVPSAALPGTENLILYGPKIRTRWALPPLDVSYEVSCEPIAEVATVITDLLPHVRWRGQPHAGYEAWLQDEPQPLPPAVRVDRPTWN